MTKRELEGLLREAAKLAKDRDFFLIGSQAIRGVSAAIPRDFPKTVEADIYPRRYPQTSALLREKLGKGTYFYHKHGYYLDCTDPALSTLPDGWLERLIAFRTPPTGGVTAWCLEPHDLFVSKLVAWRNKDQLFLRALRNRKRSSNGSKTFPFRRNEEKSYLNVSRSFSDKKRPRIKRR